MATADRSKAGRPRSAHADQVIREVALQLALNEGFAAVTMESVARLSGVAKTTLYRRWPDRGQLLVEAFLESADFPNRIDEELPFREALIDRMARESRFFESPLGGLLRQLLGAARHDSELEQALRSRWMLPRRFQLRRYLAASAKQGNLKPGVDLEVAIDVLDAVHFGPFLLGERPKLPGEIRLTLAAILDGIGVPESETP